jgi:hypothetical protein
MGQKRYLTVFLGVLTTDVSTLWVYAATVMVARRQVLRNGDLRRFSCGGEM